MLKILCNELNKNLIGLSSLVLWTLTIVSILTIWEGKFTFVTKPFSDTHNSENCAHISDCLYYGSSGNKLHSLYYVATNFNFAYISWKRSISTGDIMINLILMYMCVRHERETIFTLWYNYILLLFPFYAGKAFNAKFSNL